MVDQAAVRRCKDEAKFRTSVWHRLQEDDANGMEEVLYTYASDSNQSMGESLLRTEKIMWNPQKHDDRARGLLEVCCTNKAGIPDDGAPKCAERTVRLMLEHFEEKENEAWVCRTMMAHAARWWTGPMLKQSFPACFEKYNLPRVGGLHPEHSHHHKSSHKTSSRHRHGRHSHSPSAQEGTEEKEDSEQGPKAVVFQWVEVFNRGDTDVLVEIYDENAVLEQVKTDPITGKEAISQFFDREFESSAKVLLIENLFEDGDWAILEWKVPDGVRGCTFFQVKGGKIVFQRQY